jgi:hypothetical protein
MQKSLSFYDRVALERARFTIVGTDRARECCRAPRENLETVG